MRMLVGPVSSESARAWITYARAVLDAFDDGADPATDSGGPDGQQIVSGFRTYLDAWERAARRAEMSWSGEIDPDEARFMVYAFFNVVTRLTSAPPSARLPASPPEGDAFYQALVASLLDALENEGGALRSFAEDLRDRWPGVEPS